MSISIQIGKKS